MSSTRRADLWWVVLETTETVRNQAGYGGEALTDGFVQSSRDKGQAVGGIPGYRAQSVWTGSVAGNYFLLDLEYSGNKFVSFKRFVWGLGARYRFRDFYGWLELVPDLLSAP
ncbi:hypothetical protein ACJJTC_010841 [Scirpophaga incertulas]